MLLPSDWEAKTFSIHHKSRIFSLSPSTPTRARCQYIFSSSNKSSRVYFICGSRRQKKARRRRKKREKKVMKPRVKDWAKYYCSPAVLGSMSSLLGATDCDVFFVAFLSPLFQNVHFISIATANSSFLRRARSDTSDGAIFIILKTKLFMKEKNSLSSCSKLNLEAENVGKLFHARFFSALNMCRKSFLLWAAHKIMMRAGFMECNESIGN